MEIIYFTKFLKGLNPKEIGQAVKNVRYVAGTSAEGRRWQRQWCYLDEGLVDWASAIDLLRQAGFDGPLSVHGEYSASQGARSGVQRVAHDMDYLQRIMERSKKEASDG